jgi:hypothetical protein
MGLDHFAEREGSIDDRPERACLESLGDVVNGSVAPGVVAASQPDVVRVVGPSARAP